MLSFVIGCSPPARAGTVARAQRHHGADLPDPFIKGLNSMPRLIMAPIFAVWFGLGIWSKVALGVTLVFFVVFFNVFQGIREVSPVLIANRADARREPQRPGPSGRHPVGDELGVLKPASFV